MEYRIEKDLLGEKKIPRDIYWGIHTQRAKDNFTLSGSKVSPRLIKSMAKVKKAAALSNLELGFLEKDKASAIISACDEVIAGKLDGQFPLDALQGGAGTSTNMNVNEVIANRAIELLGGKIGDDRLVHPLEDVNLHQSTNDVYPTALKIAVMLALRELSEMITGLQDAFQKKENEFARIVKIGRTELQEAVPLSMGAEFSAYSEAVARDRWRVFKCQERLRVVNMGGTAVGTGLASPRSYIFLVIEKLRELTGIGLSRGENTVDQTANSDAFVEVCGILNAHAGNLIKIANDLRILHALGEIKLPVLQAGSSIMPGKVNPVVLESVIQAGLKVNANCGMVFEAASRSTLQINEFMPLLAQGILESLDLLINTCAMFKTHVYAISADEEKCQEYFKKSPVIITAFLPHIGYDQASKILKEFAQTKNENIQEFLGKKLGDDLVKQVLSVENLMSLGYKQSKSNDPEGA